MSDMQHTIWLWMEGVSARRIAYFLLIKGLTASVSDLLAGKSTKSNLQIMPIYPEPPLKWNSLDPEFPHPEGASNPCMRVTDPATGASRFLYESTYILLSLEVIYPDIPMQPNNSIERGQMFDLLGQINLVGIDTNYKLRNTIPEHGMMMGLMPENQSQSAAENAQAQELKGYLKLQTWARGCAGLEAGWLTPGIEGPGLVDVALAPNIRFVELVWGIDTLEAEALTPLSEWYRRFKALSFWEEYEDREGIMPPMLSFGKESRAAWVKQVK